ncbi:hypothetical protein GCM10007291_45190 [Gemmobacter nanjingensis]|uniref:Uncharacterized protein n=1 Tax=Gemmobacter nanjingensis TaxID=488454 RepID=A0ABQ3FSS4_9RHOB|nr:hypothetical protein [Gemmobacter nanjingensis]GHC38546.1 hypothetical protein GCM10007291_45190 [Gemmobacter nanjingensis]
MAFTAYSLAPIDFGWEHCPTVAEYTAMLKADDVMYGPEVVEQFYADFQTAKDLARDVGWEGDFRGDAHVFLVPTEEAFQYGFAWKQDNNGITFIVSPVKLPHLV